MSLTVVYLAAGYATRLYPLTKDRPKALLPLTRGLILDDIVAAVSRAPGISRQVLVTNHRFAEDFTRWQREARALVEILDDGTETAETRLGAIRDLELARMHAGGTGDLLVLGTDNLFSWPVADFLRQAQARAPRATIGLWEAPLLEAVTQFGVAVLDGEGRITRFVEKSPEPPSLLVALCMYYFPEAMTGRIAQFIGEGGNPDAPGYFLEWLVRQEPVYGARMRGAWHDIGSLDTYQAVAKSWRSPVQQSS